MALTQQQQQVLQEAREKAAKLVAELEQKAAELENVPKLTPQQLEEGKSAMQNAIFAVKKALETIETAAAVADRIQRPPA
jgi:hypothetical protein